MVCSNFEEGILGFYSELPNSLVTLKTLILSLLALATYIHKYMCSCFWTCMHKTCMWKMCVTHTNASYKTFHHGLSLLQRKNSIMVCSMHSGKPRISLLEKTEPDYRSLPAALFQKQKQDDQCRSRVWVALETQDKPES